MIFFSLTNIEMRNSIMHIINDVDIFFINHYLLPKTYKDILSRQKDGILHTDPVTFINHLCYSCKHEFLSICY